MERLKGNTYFLPTKGPTIGGYLVGDQLMLIDTGLDDSSARKAIRDFDAPYVKYIFNTHSHADHCGGNAYLQRQFDSFTIAPEVEASFIVDPILEPTYLYGALPPEFMKNKFTMAKPSEVHRRVEKEGPFSLSFEDGYHKFTLYDLKGHSPNMMGIATPDNILFLGDALISEEMIEKHPLIFTYDVEAHFKCLDKIGQLDYDGYVISHGGYYDHLDHVIAANRNILMITQKHLTERIQQGACTIEQLHGHLNAVYGLKENPAQHVLNQSVIKAHLTYLHKSGVISYIVSDGVLKITSEPDA